MKKTITLICLFACSAIIMAGNPVMESTSTTSSGYLVGFSGWSNDELKKVDVSISDLLKLMSDYKSNNNNPVLKNTFNTYSSGYLVGIDNYSNPEIRKVNISIADLKKMMDEFENNPKLKNTFSTYSSGYLVGIGSNSSNSEIKKINISIAELQTMMNEFKELKKTIESLETDNGIGEITAMKKEINELKQQISGIEGQNQLLQQQINGIEEQNDLFKEQLTKMEATNAALYEYVNFTPPDDDTADKAPLANSLPVVYAQHKTIIVDNVYDESVSVYNLDGETIINIEKANGTVYIPLMQTGVYLVKVGAYNTIKIAVPQ